MDKKEALEVYPVLVGLDVLDLIILRKEAITVYDKLFQKAIDVVLNE